MIKQLLNSVIEKYCDLSVSCRSIICFSIQLLQIIDLLATDKSRYFAQPCPIIVNYFYFQKILDLGEIKNSQSLFTLNSELLSNSYSWLISCKLKPSNAQPAVQMYFVQAQAACLCSYCCFMTVEDWGEQKQEPLGNEKR